MKARTKARTLAVSAMLIGVNALPAAGQTLTVSVTGTGKITGTGIDCPTDCREDFLPTRIGAGTGPAMPRNIVLTASITPIGWGGACTGTTGLTCTVNIAPGGATVSAAFSLPVITYPDIPQPGLQVQPKGAGKVTGPGIDCPPDCYEPGFPTRVLTARPEPGGSFLGWSGGVPGGDCSGTEPTCTSGGGGPSVVSATFSAMLTVAILGGGRVTSVKIDCPGDCQEAYAAGSSVTLTATSNSGYAFAGWGGDCAAAGTAPTCTMKMGTRNSVTAQFLPSAIRLPGRP